MNRNWLTLVPGHVVCRPEELGYRTDLPVLAVPAARSLRIDRDTSVELRVTPGQHQFVVTHRNQQWVETVGLFDDGVAHLPVLRRLPRPAEFVSDVEVGCTVTSHSPRGLAKDLARLREALDNAPLALCVQDPEEPTAVTAACCYLDPAENSLLWRTWRTLPESGSMVRTRARLNLVPAPCEVAA